MGLLFFLFVYILGGLTFLPGLLVLYVFVKPKVESYIHDDKDSAQSESLKAGELEENHQSGLETYKSGWIFVTRDYIESPDEINSSTQLITESNDNKSAYSALYKLVKDLTTKRSKESDQSKESRLFDDLDGDEVNTDTFVLHKDSGGDTHLHGSLNQSQKPTIRSSQKKHRYFAVLKHGNLFLYKDQTLKDVKHVIVLANYFATLWPRDLTDAQLFTKYSAIALINPSKLSQQQQQQHAPPATPVSSSSPGSSASSRNNEFPNPSGMTAPRGSFFIYCDICSEKEDWFFALIRAMKLEKSELPELLNPLKFAKTLHFETKEMINLIQTLYSSEGQLQTKWINAIIGRWFLSMKNTKQFEDYVYKKLSKKLNKIKTPGFFDQFQITDIQPGSLAPFFTYPNLKEINPDGTVLVSSYVTYTGGISVTIATKVDLTFGTKFTNKEVDLVLKITLAKLEGPMLFKLKPPPSGRFWYCYEVDPIMNFKIEPLLSSRTFNFNFITNSIEKKFKEAIKESLVLPQWDDIVFFDSSDQLYRAGIWEEPKLDEDETTEKEAEGANGEADGASDLTSLDKYDDIETKSELSMSSRSLRSSKFSTTLTDLSKRMKKKSSSPNLEDQMGTTTTTTVTTPTTNNTGSTIMANTFKKIGKWYFKDDSFSKTAQEEKPYTPPEMISSRRPPRKSSNSLEPMQRSNSRDENISGPAVSSAFTNHMTSTATAAATAAVAGASGVSSKNSSSTALNQTPSYNFSKFDNSDNVNVFTSAYKDDVSRGVISPPPSPPPPPRDQQHSRASSVVTAPSAPPPPSYAAPPHQVSSATPGLVPPPLPPRDVSDSASIRSELFAADPTVGISQPPPPATPSRTKTVSRKAPPKSPSLSSEGNNTTIDEL
ncbi:hypothetical protein Cantr_00702 [Candida viswanathii]|uniref:SMP-LTD domain-containing protein n=1 Tax=Candida viswanathii TaxID=5486 RepID=A0A367YIY4_9ASCO|nr:hypothetical protein Cantr_00702 [Candida viswanathii]